MGTPAIIARRNQDGSYDSIRTHWDGYPEHHLPILRAKYKTPATVAKLIALGNLSVLGPRIGKRVDFDTFRGESQCVAYGRDRGESGEGPQHDLDQHSFFGRSKDDAEHVYVFTVATKTWKHVKLA